MNILILSFLFLSLPITSVFALQETTVTGLGATKKVRAELIMPDGQGPFPAVLVLHTSKGVKKYDITYAENLAQKGYACLIPYYFEPYYISYETRNWATTAYAEDILHDFTSEIEYLKSLPKINKEKIAALGFSMGGYWALVLAAKKTVLAGVSYYGTLKSGDLDSPIKYRLSALFKKGSSPALILHGQEDMTVDVKYAQELADLLKGEFCTYELKTYPFAGHYFDRGSSLNDHATGDSWKRSLAFLKKYLKI